MSPVRRTSNTEAPRTMGNGSNPTCSGLLRSSALLRLLRGLAEPNRLRLLALLARCERACVKELAAALPVDLSVVSRHLKMLEELSIVSVNRSGRSVFYSLNREYLLNQLSGLTEALRKQESPPGAK